MIDSLKRLFSPLVPVICVWVALLAFALWKDGDWPNDRHYVWGTLAIMATFLILVATLMIRNMDGFDWLTVSLAFAFASSSLMPFYLMASVLWRDFFIHHRSHLLIGTCILIITPCVLAIFMLLHSGENGYARRHRNREYE